MATAPYVSFTPEKSNFLRLCRAIIDVGTEVLRLILSQSVIPTSILHEIKAKKLKLKLHQKRALTTISDYKDLDISFLYYLIRGLCKNVIPTRGWDPPSPPLPKEVTLGDDIERIHFIRNSILAHSNEAFLGDKVFHDHWEELENLLDRVDVLFGSNFKQSLLTIEIDTMDLETIRKGYLKDLKQEIIDQWDKVDESFCETKASKHVATGPPGSGKSAIAHHIAMDLQNADYQIVPVTSVEDLEKSWIQGTKQVFVLDDVFGATKIDEAEIEKWFIWKDKAKICFQNNKIIVTMRKQYSYDKRLQTLFREFQYSMVDITKKDLLLSENEKRSIFAKHMSVSKKETKCNETVKNCEFLFFPLLCRLFSTDNESKYELNSFFKNPLSVLKSEIELLRENKDVKYLGLVLCTVYDNILSVKLFNIGEESAETKQKREDFAECCGFSRSISRQEIKRNLDLLLNTYIFKESHNYKFIHDIIYDVVVSTLTPEFQLSILKHCSSKFINQRVVLSPAQTVIDEIQPFIVLDNELMQEWMNRLILDINRGNYLDVFLNTCLRDETIEELVLAELKISTLSKDDFFKVIHRSEKESASNIFDKQFEQFSLDNFDSNAYLKRFTNLMFYMFTIDYTIADLIVANNLNKIFSYVYGMLSESEKEALVTDVNVIHIAALYCNKVVFKLCFDRLKLTHIDDNDRLMLLMMSVVGGNVDIAEHVLENVDKENPILHKFETTMCFLVAVLFGEDKIVKLLIDKGCDIAFDSTSNDGRNITLRKLFEKTSSEYLPLLFATSNDDRDLAIQTMYEKINLDFSPQASNDCHHVILPTGITKAFREWFSPWASLFSLSNSTGQISVQKIFGNNSTAQLLLEHCTSADKNDKCLTFALILASYNGHDKVVRILIENGAKVSECNNNVNTAIHLASMNGHGNVVKTLIENGANVTESNNNGNTALHLASHNGHSNVVKTLIENGANVTKSNNNGVTALHLASQNGHDSVVKTLIENSANVTGCDNNGVTALHLASMNGHDSVVKILTEHGANVSRCNNNGNTALHLASYNGHDNVVKTLIENSASVTKSNNNGDTALHLASLNGHDTVVKTLIGNSATVTKSNNNGDTALHLASLNGHDTVVKTLIGNSATVTKSNNNGLTALHAAALKGHDSVVKILIQNGATVTGCDNNGLTALHLASYNGHDSVVKILIENGAKGTECNNNGNTALHLASQNGHDSVVKTLIENGANVTKSNNNGDTPLHLASFNGHDTVVKTLIENGAKVTECNNKGVTALHLASQNGHDSVVKTLIENGAKVTECNNNGNTALHLASLNGHDTVVKTLIENSASVTKSNNNGDTALHLASFNGHDTVVKTLIENGAKVTECNNKGVTALHLASLNRHDTVVKTLIENSAKVTGCDNNGVTALHLASMNGHDSVVKILIENSASVTKSNNNGDTALHLASLNGHDTVVKTLIGNSATVTKSNNNGDTALHLASLNGHDTVVKTLIGNSATVTKSNNNGDTALHLASLNGHDTVVKTLIGNSATVTKSNNNGDTALHIASYNGHDSVVKTLIENGVNVTGCDNDGATALHLAAMQGHDNIIHTLIDQGVSVNTCNNHGFTPLHLSSRNGHTTTLQKLINNLSDIKYYPLAFRMALSYCHDNIAYTLFYQTCKYIVILFATLLYQQLHQYYHRTEVVLGELQRVCDMLTIMIQTRTRYRYMLTWKTQS